jgi:Putative metallopeptidase
MGSGLFKQSRYRRDPKVGLSMRATASICFAALLLPSLALPCHAQAVDAMPIPIEYVVPTKPAHQPIYETLKANRVLEQFQEFFRIFPMSKPFGFKLAGCDGEANAWYDPDDRMITICYEYVEEAQRLAPKRVTSAGVTPEDAVVGPVIETFLHEAAHALFDVFKIPILGREEDAADQVAAYILVQLGDEAARRTIGGAAYNLATEAKRNRRPVIGLWLTSIACRPNAFSIACIAYGAKPTVFSDIVDKGYLPKERAGWCEDEYKQVAYAVSTLLGPHMDKAAAAEAESKAQERGSRRSIDNSPHTK